MAKKQVEKSKVTSSKRVVREESKSGVFEYLRFGESYTSLVLGIVVVIVATILVLALLNNKNANKVNPDTQTVAVKDEQNAMTVREASISATVVPTAVTVTQVPTPTKPAPTKAPTVAPTAVKKTTATVVPSATPAKTIVKQGQKGEGKVYTVVAGDSLWSIAEKEYKSGYNWVDIAQVNKLHNPNSLEKGIKLTLPKVQPKVATISTTPDKQVVVANKITSSTYKIVKGDSLWNIAVRAYGDGYKWIDIAKANGLKNPNVIHSQNTLKIPRGK